MDMLFNFLYSGRWITDLLYFLFLFPFSSLQLRNLVWATWKHAVYLMSHFLAVHWSASSYDKSEVLNVSGHVAPCEVHIFFSIVLLHIFFQTFPCISVTAKVFLRSSCAEDCCILTFYAVQFWYRNTRGIYWKDFHRLKLVH